MAYGIVRTDAMYGTKNPDGVVAIKYQVSNTDTAIENGCVVVVGDFATTGGATEVRLGATPTATAAKATIALIASPEIDKTKAYNTLGGFRNEAGTICTGYRFGHTGQIFSLTTDAIEKAAGVTVAKGTILELKAGNKLYAVSAPTANSTKIATVVDVEGDWFVCEEA